MSESIRYLVGEIYCEVLFELAEEAGKIDMVMQDLARVGEVLKAEFEFTAILKSETIRGEDKAVMIRNVFGGKLETLTLDFLSVLAKRNRIGFLPNILGKYELLVDVYHQRHLVEVTVASSLEHGQLEKLKADISEAIKSEVKLTVEVDPSIISGIIIKKGDTVIDNTVKRALQRRVASFVEKVRPKLETRQVEPDN